MSTKNEDNAAELEPEGLEITLSQLNEVPPLVMALSEIMMMVSGSMSRTQILEDMGEFLGSYVMSGCSAAEAEAHKQSLMDSIEKGQENYKMFRQGLERHPAASGGPGGERR